MTYLHAFLPWCWAVILVVALAGGWRVWRGPTFLDRLLGLDTLTVAVASMIAVDALWRGNAVMLELIIAVTALGFFTTVAFFYYLTQNQRELGQTLNEEREEPSGQKAPPSVKPPSDHD